MRAHIRIRLEAIRARVTSTLIRKPTIKDYGTMRTDAIDLLAIIDDLVVSNEVHYKAALKEGWRKGYRRGTKVLEERARKAKAYQKKKQIQKAEVFRSKHYVSDTPR